MGLRPESAVTIPESSVTFPRNDPAGSAPDPHRWLSCPIFTSGEEEYHATHGERAYQYSQFCWHYQRFNGSLARSMRQTHRAGEKLFIDYSGDTVPVINVVTGEILRAQIFVASMGASKYPLN